MHTRDGGIVDMATRTWSPQILVYMHGQQRPRFNRLLEDLKPISDRVLTERLRDLVDAGLVLRHVNPASPVRVAYELSDSGRRAAEILQQLFELEHGERLAVAR